MICWRLSSHRCQAGKILSNGSCHEGGNPTVLQTLCHVNQSWPESSIISQCAALPSLLIPNLSEKSYPAVTVLPFAKNLPLCTVTSDEDICIWLCVVTAQQLQYNWHFLNLKWGIWISRRKVNSENLVKTLCTFTSDEDIYIWLRLFWSNGIATIQLTLFWIIFSLPKKLISWHFIVHCKRVIKKSETKKFVSSRSRSCARTIFEFPAEEKKVWNSCENNTIISNLKSNPEQVRNLNRTKLKWLEFPAEKKVC